MFFNARTNNLRQPGTYYLFFDLQQLEAGVLSDIARLLIFLLKSPIDKATLNPVDCFAWASRMPISNDSLVAIIPYLRRYTRGLTNDNVLADRIVQQCIDCARDLQQFVKHHKADAEAQKIWLFSILHNIYGEFLNEQNSLLMHLRDHSPVREDDVASRRQHIENDTYLRALAELPLLQRQIFLLVSVEKFLYEEVAKIVNMPLGAVLSLLNTARRTLAEKIFSSGETSMEPADDTDHDSTDSDWAEKVEELGISL